MRPRLIVGNWKMHKTATEAVQFVRQLLELVPAPKVDVVLAPPFTALHAVAQSLPSPPPYALAGQNLYWEDQGAFTGEISAPMLKDLGCRYVIIGHSERRQWFGDHDDGINKKIKAALRHGLHPILCVGETLTQREQGGTDIVVSEQMQHGLKDVSQADMEAVSIAYEPVWAIGTGRAATPQQAVAVHQVLRSVVAQAWGEEAGNQMRILYGGSVSPDNAGDLFVSDEIDGALVGGSCVDPHRFAKIIALA
ncbi:MAG TPA: triose-phosphate isomerase [Nitrospiraceae bacterium]|nr:triose-phosphate isomerase [Nitrospiraceae bacterium]